MARIQDIDIPYLEFAEAAAPGTPASGIVRAYAKTDGLMYQKDDAGVETAMGGGGGAGPAYSDWVPVLTAASVNPTLGSGSAADGRYFQDGDHVVADGYFEFGAGGGAAAGTGAYRISLPVNALTTSLAYVSIGHAYMYDANTGNLWNGIMSRVSTSTAQIILANNANPVGAAVPWTWAASDVIVFHLDYEAA